MRCGIRSRTLAIEPFARRWPACAEKHVRHDLRMPGRLCSRSVKPAIRVRTPAEIRSARRPRRHRCWGHLIAAPLWPLHDANLGTLLRTCDAVGACLAVPPFDWVDRALARGNTLRQPACVHRVGSPLRWLADERRAGATIIGVELADEAVRLADLSAARRRTVIVLGHEATGIPPQALDQGREVRRTGWPSMSGLTGVCLMYAGSGAPVETACPTKDIRCRWSSAVRSVCHHPPDRCRRWGLRSRSSR